MRQHVNSEASPGGFPFSGQAVQPRLQMMLYDKRQHFPRILGPCKTEFSVRSVSPRQIRACQSFSPNSQAVKFWPDESLWQAKLTFQMPKLVNWTVSLCMFRRVKWSPKTESTGFCDPQNLHDHLMIIRQFLRCRSRLLTLLIRRERYD